jgi:cytochrome c556
MLSARMDRHGEEMMLLLQSVLTLHHEDAELLAEQVAAEPRLGRPSPGEKGTLSALLPARFFTLQEQLVERAHALAAAARDNDNGRIVRAYGQLAETCVSCHSVYLTPDADFELPGD